MHHIMTHFLKTSVTSILQSSISSVPAETAAMTLGHQLMVQNHKADHVEIAERI